MQDNEPINLTYGQLSDMVNRIEQIPPLYGVGAPTSSTPAFFLGQTYIDQETGKSYYCSGVEEESGDESGAIPAFIWKEGGKTYTAGANIQINGNTISATDTTYTAGTNVQINGTTISATDTKYTAGTGLNLSNGQFAVDTTVIAQKTDIPTVNNATLTIQKNGSQVGTFTANASSNSTVNITVPTNNNELTNGAGYQNSTQVQNAINSAIAGITSFDYQIVSTLPASGVKGTIYLVPTDESGVVDNYYEEYIWVVENNVGHWELIGTTKIDLNSVSDSDWEALFGAEIEDVNNVGF